MSDTTFVLFDAPKVHIFSLPPSDFLKSELWQGHYIWSGQLKFVREGGARFAVRLLEKDSNELFGECPVRDSSDNAAGSAESVQPATDSTRAFVLRVEDGDQFSYVGLMFDDRTVAYNFSSALIHRRKGVGPAPVLEVQDHSLERGEHITVDLFNKVRSKTENLAPASAVDVMSPTEIPRVSLDSLQISTAGKSRRVKLGDVHGAATAAVAAAAQQQLQEQIKPAAAPAPAATKDATDDLFGTAAPAPAPAPAKETKPAAGPKTATAADIAALDAVLGEVPAMEQKKDKDVLDALFG